MYLKEKKYIIFDGKKMRERDLPNYVGRKNDYVHVIAKDVKFYPEDEAILKTIKNARERIEYKRKLIDEGKFIR